MDPTVVCHRASATAVAAALGRPAGIDTALAAGRATPGGAAAASGAGAGCPEAVAGRAAPSGVAEVAFGPGHRLCVEPLGGVAALFGAGLPVHRQRDRFILHLLCQMASAAEALHFWPWACAIRLSTVGVGNSYSQCLWSQ